MLDTIDRIAADYLKPAAIHAAEEGVFQQSLWEALGDVGLTTAMLPESAGGLALGLHEVCDMLSRCAYHAMPIPIAENALAIALVAASNPQWKGPLADTLIEAYSKEQHRLVLCASLQKEEQLAFRVAWASQAQALVLVDEQGTVSWCDRARQAWQVLAAKRNLAGEPREDIRIHAEHISTRSHAVGLHHRFEQMGALVRTAQMNGAMQRTLQLSIQYANERKQFGRAIGKFQAVQHMLAVLASHAAASQAAYQAALDAIALHGWGEHTPWSVAIAKARASEAAGLCADFAHQVHGAMGFTREHSLHRFTRRLYAWRDEFGNEAYWQSRVGAWTLELGAEALWDHLVRH